MSKPLPIPRASVTTTPSQTLEGGSEARLAWSGGKWRDHESYMVWGVGHKRDPSKTPTQRELGVDNLAKCLLIS